MKKCTRCQCLLPFDQFARRKDGYADGYRSMCRGCDSKRKEEHTFSSPDRYQKYKSSLAQHKQRNKEAFNAGEIAIPLKKKCGKCGKVKPADQFWAQKANRTGLQAYCIACASEYQAQYNHNV